MPSLDENTRRWSDSYEWADAGEEWSRAWGGSEAQWFGSILPRLHAYVPARTILEVAPGFGRWTRFLWPLCDRMVLVDLSERCIDACRERFGDEGSIEYHVNDGSSLEMVTDASIDLAFSFDSLVHAEADVIESYVTQLRHKLTEDGVAFLHHSNFAALDEGTENRHWRSESVSAGDGLRPRRTCGAVRRVSRADQLGRSRAHRLLHRAGTPGFALGGADENRRQPELHGRSRADREVGAAVYGFPAEAWLTRSNPASRGGPLRL